MSAKLRTQLNKKKFVLSSFPKSVAVNLDDSDTEDSTLYITENSDSANDCFERLFVNNSDKDSQILLYGSDKNIVEKDSSGKKISKFAPSLDTFSVSNTESMASQKSFYSPSPISKPKMKLLSHTSLDQKIASPKIAKIQTDCQGVLNTEESMDFEDCQERYYVSVPYQSVMSPKMIDRCTSLSPVREKATSMGSRRDSAIKKFVMGLLPKSLFSLKAEERPVNSEKKVKASLSKELPPKLQKKIEKIKAIIAKIKRESVLMYDDQDETFFKSAPMMYSDLLLQKANKYIQLINESVDYTASKDQSSVCNGFDRKKYKKRVILIKNSVEIHIKNELTQLIEKCSEDNLYDQQSYKRLLKSAIKLAKVM